MSDLAHVRLTGRQTPAERDAGVDADPALQTVPSERQRERAARDAAIGDFMARARGHYAYWEEHPSPKPEFLDT